LMPDRTGSLARKVLNQRASESDVGDLEAAADGEGRRSVATRRLEESEVRVVPIGVELETRIRARLLAVPPGIDVAAAAEDDSVEVPVHPGSRRHEHDLFARDPRRDEGGNVVVFFARGRVAVERQSDAHAEIL